MTAKRKSDLLDAALATLGKDYSHLGASAASQAPVWDAIPTGILSLDQAIGIGGFPRGQITEISGPPKQGKSVVALETIVEAQRAGLDAAYINAEHRFNPAWAARLGVDLERLLLIPGGKELKAEDEKLPPMTAEDAFGAIERLVEIGMPLIFLDSIAVLTPRAEMEGEMGDSHMGVQSRLFAQFCRKLPGKVARHGTALVVLNQVTANMGVSYGPTTKEKGGFALQHQISLHIKIAKAATSIIKEGETKVGIRSKATVIVNTVAAPFGETEFDIYFGKCGCHGPGVDKAADLLDLAVARGAVEKSGTWLSFNGERLGQGRVAAAESLRNPELAEAVRKAVLGG